MLKHQPCRIFAAILTICITFSSCAIVLFGNNGTHHIETISQTRLVNSSPQAITAGLNWFYDDQNGNGEYTWDLKPVWDVASPSTDAIFGTACVGSFYIGNYYAYLVKYFINGTNTWIYYMPGANNFAASGVASLPGGAVLFAAQSYNNSFIRFQLVTPSGVANGSYWDFTTGPAHLYLTSMATATTNATVWVVGNRVVGTNSSIFLLKVNPYTESVSEFNWNPSAIVHAGRCVSDGDGGLFVTGFTRTSPSKQLLVAHFTANGACIRYSILSNATEQLGCGIDYNGREVVVVGFRGTGVTNMWDNYAWTFDSSLNLIQPILLNGTAMGPWDPEAIDRDRVSYIETQVIFPYPVSNNFVATCFDGTNAYNYNPSIIYWDDTSKAITASFFVAISTGDEECSIPNLIRTWDGSLISLGDTDVPYSDNIMSQYIQLNTTFPVMPFRPLYNLPFTAVNGNLPEYYVPVTLVNSQGTATPVNFQARISIDSDANSMYYAPDLANVNWQDNGETILYSWLESGASSNSNASVYWMNLGSHVIPAGENLTIYQVIYSTIANVMNTKNTGEAPELSTPYGQYDDGVNVFSFYDNFAGSKLSSKWVNNTATSTGTVTVNNGVTIGKENVSTFSPQLSSASKIDGPAILDFHGIIPLNGLNSSWYCESFVGIFSNMNLSNGVVIGTTGYYNHAAYVFQPININNGYGYSFDGDWGYNATYSILVPSSGVQTSLSVECNYGGSTTFTSGLPMLPQFISFLAQVNGTTLGPFYWVRTRAYTANDIMPIVTSGSIMILSAPQPSPSITQPANIKYDVGTTGHSISWTITSAYPGISNTSYIVCCNGTQITTGSWTNGTPITIAVDGLAIGIYNYTIVASDGLGGSVQDTVIVTVNVNTGLFITHPPDITYNQGAMWNSISWTITTNASTNNASYAVYCNGTQITTGAWTSGTPVIIYIDKLAISGIYNYTIIANDGLGGSLQDTVMVTLIATVNTWLTITHPSDIIYNEWATGNSISWIINSSNHEVMTNTKEYVIYRNGTRVANGSWLYDAPVTFTIGDLAIGIYNYTIVAIDGIGDSVQSTVLVTVRQTLWMTIALLLSIVAIAAIPGIAVRIVAVRKKKSITKIGTNPPTPNAITAAISRAWRKRAALEEYQKPEDTGALAANPLTANKVVSGIDPLVDGKFKKNAVLDKYQKIEDINASNTTKDAEELQKTEQEVTAILDVKLCIVHKGPIKGANYSCPQCNTFYCLKCAAALASAGERCWSCGNKIELDARLRTLYS
ncbi:MAG TPA: hypothetical protein VKM55_02655 [Candidatus Lokiarchaeia archaeon]|nr:hypothetical protein [Candidatus Lokiarchaeia archaeon]